MSVSPVYVVGPSRSGTTLTTEIIGRHSRVLAQSAIALLREIDGLRVGLGDGVSPTEARGAVRDLISAYYVGYPDAATQAHLEDLVEHTDLAGRLLAARSHGEMLQILLDEAEASGKKSRWVQHSPGSVYRLAGIFARRPDAKVVLCVRHPLDYLVSYRDSFRRAERRNRPRHDVERLRKLYHPVITSLLWVSNVRAIRRAVGRHGEQVLVSRYEDLVADPEGGVRRICAFVGCEFEPTMLTISSNNSSETVTQSGIFASSVGRWRTGLTPSEAVIAQKICGREMERLGYAREPIPADMADVARQLLTTPLFAWRALRASQIWSSSRLRHVSRQISALVRG